MGRFIVYRTENTINGKFYYGVHDTKSRDSKHYLGSGLLLKKAIKKYSRDNFVRRTVKKFDNRDDANAFEALIVDQDFVDRNDCYNKALGGQGGAIYDKHPMLGKKHSRESKAKMRESQIKLKESGYIRYNSKEVEWDGVKYPSLYHASEATGIPKTTLGRWIKNGLPKYEFNAWNKGNKTSLVTKISEEYSVPQRTVYGWLYENRKPSKKYVDVYDKIAHLRA